MSPIEPVVRVLFPEEKMPFKLMQDICPICGSEIVLSEVGGLELDDNGEWIATEITLECTSEPDIDSDGWNDWLNSHYQTPYIDWLPLEQKILKVVRTRYYFAP